MSVNRELALAAARVRLLTEQLPEQHRPDVAREWSELLDEVERCRADGAKVHAIVEWCADFEYRMSNTLVHAPLTEPQTPPRPRKDCNE